MALFNPATSLIKSGLSFISSLRKPATPSVPAPSVSSLSGTPMAPAQPSLVQPKAPTTSAISSLRAPVTKPLAPKAPVAPTAPPTPAVPKDTIASITEQNRIAATAPSAASLGNTGPSIESPKPITTASAPRAIPVPASGVPADLKSQLDSLRKGALSTYDLSPEERATKEALANLRESAQLGVTGLEGQGRGIPLSLVRGQQEKLTKQAAIQEQTLMERLANASAERQLAQAKALAELGYTREDIKQFQEDQAAQQAASKPIEVGGALVRLNPTTGEYESVFTPPKETKPIQVGDSLVVFNPATNQYESVFDAPAGEAEGFSLGEGQARYDAQGNLIAARGKTTGSGTGSGSGGLSALAQQIKANPALLDNLTPTEKGRVLSQLATEGVDLADFALPDLNAGQREKLSTFDNLLGTSSTVGQLIESGIKTGPLASRQQSASRSIFGGGEQFGNLSSLISNMATTLLNLRSGAAVTPEEFARLSPLIPSINDQESVIKQKVASFNAELAAARDNFTRRAIQTSAQIAAPINNQVTAESAKAKYGITY